jgi:ATP-binding cassette subfamily C exporter for protease/lipase
MSSSATLGWMRSPQEAVRDAAASVRGGFLKALSASLVVNLLILTPTLYMLQLYERVLYSMNGLTLAAVSLLAALLLACMGLADRWRGAWQTRAASDFQQRLQGPLFQAGWRAALAGGRSEGPHRQRDLASVRQFLAGPGFAGLLDLPWTPVYVAVTWLLHPVLGASVLVFAVLQALLAWKGHGLSLQPAAALQTVVIEEAASTGRMFRQSEAVAAMGMAPGLRGQWLQRHRRSLAATQRTQVLANRLTALSKTLRYLQQSAALGIGAWLAVRGEISAGAMIAGTVLTTRALAPIDAVVTVWKDLLAAVAALGRIDASLRAAPAGAPELTEHEVPAGEALTLDEVSAWVPGVERPILRGISLTLAPGQVHALVGPSGAGKSTLARLLAGAWPCAFGGVWRPSLSLGLGYLPQEVVLFPGTVAENIARLGPPQGDAVVAAARRVGLHEQILRLPKGYDTVVGEGGHPLSGGLCQRIGLARALFGDPPLVILDEPAAHLDEAGERVLEAVLADLRQAGRTVLIVTHARPLLRVADRILILDQGQIVADERPAPGPLTSASPC